MAAVGFEPTRRARYLQYLCNSRVEYRIKKKFGTSLGLLNNPRTLIDLNTVLDQRLQRNYAYLPGKKWPNFLRQMEKYLSMLRL